MSESIAQDLGSQRVTDPFVEPRKAEFARRLIAVMRVRGLGPAELTRLVRRYLPPDSHFQAANIAQYRSGAAIPKPIYRQALCNALNLKEEELIPRDQGHSVQRRRVSVPIAKAGGPPGFLVRDRGDGTASVHLHQDLPWATVVKIVEVLGQEASAHSAGAAGVESDTRSANPSSNNVIDN